MTTHLTSEESMNPFMSDSFNLHDLSLMTEAIGLYVKNDSRMMYSALEIMEVGKIKSERKRKVAFQKLKPRYEGQALSGAEISRLDLIDGLIVGAMGAKEAEAEVESVIHALEEHLKENEK